MPSLAKTSDAFKCCNLLIIQAGRSTRVLDEEFFERYKYTPAERKRIAISGKKLWGKDYRRLSAKDWDDLEKTSVVDFTRVVFGSRCPKCGSTYAHSS